MKTLHLLRHAKSSWEDEDLDDHARPLSGRGRRNARAMGRFLSRRGFAPGRVRCSTARRAVDTWRRVAEALPETIAPILEEDLYLADVERLLEIVRREEEDAESLLLVGHNPGLAELALALCGQGPPERLRRLAAKLPTGAWVEIALGCDAWRDVRPGGGRLVEFQVPRELG